MTLSLYSNKNKNLKTVFCWEPNEKQWWIIGFNPRFTNPEVEDLTMIGTVDFSGMGSMYNDFKKIITAQYDLSKYVMFDVSSNITYRDFSSFIILLNLKIIIHTRYTGKINSSNHRQILNLWVSKTRVKPYYPPLIFVYHLTTKLINTIS
ncbi:hypothetical protein FACS1894132_12680 [Clostridia bacterium]|nr:hypothetical protein FACS1894132_12680 [Clostridia bacterium]